MNLTEYIDSKRDEHLNELYEFLRIPSVSAQSEHKPDIERAAKWVAEKLRAAGLDNVEIPADEDASAGIRRIAAAGARQTDHPVLRPLRCAAGRAAGPLDIAGV